MSSPLFKTLKMGALTLPNRIIMAPLTRARAALDAVPTPLMAEYYAQRASAGLLIAESTAISKRGYGWTKAPGIFNAAQVKGWQLTTAAVHKAGGRIFLQLWHMGRLSHPDFQNGQLPVAPSAVMAKGKSREGRTYVTPRALTMDEIKATIEEYRTAAGFAKEAGFDGVEVHAANGYLMDQFLRDGTNKRTDIYGGLVENRVRFMLEATEVVVGVWGADRVGVRLSPRNPFHDMSDSDPISTAGASAERLNDFGLAYLHVLEGLPGHRLAEEGPRVTPVIRRAFKGVLIANCGYTKALGEEALAKGEVDAVAYGVLFMANPDLVERFRTDAPLNELDMETVYAGGAKGYTDYPFLNARSMSPA